LALASLEIGKVLADRGQTAFRAQGTCMYPCVQPGDLLHIASRTAAQIAIGDIAVCRRPAYLFSHRTVGKGAEDGRAYIITRADRARHGDDGPTYDEDVLGVVTSIERGGRHVDPRPRRYPWPMRIFLAIRLMLLESVPVMWSWAAGLLGHIQRGACYQSLARRWLLAAHPSLSYVARLPLQAGQTHDLYRPVPAEELDLAHLTWRGHAVDHWTLALHLGGSRRPAAWATLVPSPSGCPRGAWRVNQVHVRARYRGMGFEQDLIDRCEEILSRSGAPL